MASDSRETLRAEPGRVRAPTLRSNLALLAAGVLFSLLLAELVVRALGLAPAIVPIELGRFQLSSNPKIGYEPIPNFDYEGDTLRHFQYRGASNRLGFRGPIDPEAKAPGSYRIVVLGDSVTEGIGFDEYDDLYTAKLERALREAGVDAQVLNFGVSGYNTQQEVETLKDKALALEPDLVILAYVLNDTQGPYYRMLQPLLDESNNEQNPHAVGGLAERALVHSALYRLVRYRLLAPTPEEEQELTFEQYATGNTVARYIEELRQLSEQHGFQVLVVVFPKGNDRSFTAYPFREEHAFIRELASEQGFRVLDLLPAFAVCARENEKSIFRDNLHPNRRGHSCAAKAIAEFILEMRQQG